MTTMDNRDTSDDDLPAGRVLAAFVSMGLLFVILAWMSF